MSIFKVFRPRTAPEAIELVVKLLEYTPEARLDAVSAMCHSFFDELRQEGAKMPNGKEFPPLFNFTREGEYFILSYVRRPRGVFERSNASDVAGLATHFPIYSV